MAIDKETLRTHASGLGRRDGSCNLVTWISNSVSKKPRAFTPRIYIKKEKFIVIDRDIE